MSTAMSTPSMSSLMSELIQPGSGCPPHPQFMRRTSRLPAGDVSCGCECRVLTILVSGYPNLLQEPAEHPVGLEVLLREIASSTRMGVVVLGDALDAVNRLLECPEGKQTPAHRIVVAEARFLGENRSPAGQVADAAIAEPPAPTRHVHVLRHHQLGP